MVLMVTRAEKMRMKESLMINLLIYSKYITLLCEIPAEDLLEPDFGHFSG